MLPWKRKGKVCLVDFLFGRWGQVCGGGFLMFFFNPSYVTVT
jgi:hypothetical protein